MVRTTLRQPWLIALGTALAITMPGTASASPKKGAVDGDALSKALAFETALTNVAESVSPSVVSIQVEVTRPPITTVARGRCTSAPALVARAIGTNPSDATSAVINTGRKRILAPSSAA